MWTGRTTLIWGFASNGDWICMTIDKTTTTEEFSIFIFILKAYIDKCSLQTSKIVTAMIDNVAIHLTKKLKSLWKGVGIELLGLPQYCPHLAPCELVFGMTKKNIINKMKWSGVDFSKSEGQTKIAKALQKLSIQKAVNMWKSVIKIWKELVMNVWIKVKQQSIDHQSAWTPLALSKYNSEEKEEEEESKRSMNSG